jgi:hypothetical protein
MQMGFKYLINYLTEVIKVRNLKLGWCGKRSHHDQRCEKTRDAVDAAGLRLQ